MRRSSYKTGYIKIRTKERRNVTKRLETDATLVTHLHDTKIHAKRSREEKLALREDTRPGPSGSTANANLLSATTQNKDETSKSTISGRAYSVQFVPRRQDSTLFFFFCLFLILLAPSARPAARGTSAIVAVIVFIVCQRCSTDVRLTVTDIDLYADFVR